MNILNSLPINIYNENKAEVKWSRNQTTKDYDTSNWEKIQDVKCDKYETSTFYILLGN